MLENCLPHVPVEVSKWKHPMDKEVQAQSLAHEVFGQVDPMGRGVLVINPSLFLTEWAKTPQH